MFQKTAASSYGREVSMSFWCREDLHCRKGTLTGGQHKTPPLADSFPNSNIVNYIPAYKTIF